MINIDLFFIKILNRLPSIKIDTLSSEPTLVHECITPVGGTYCGDEKACQELTHFSKLKLP